MVSQLRHFMRQYIRDMLHPTCNNAPPRPNICIPRYRSRRLGHLHTSADRAQGLLARLLNTYNHLNMENYPHTWCLAIESMYLSAAWTKLSGCGEPRIWTWKMESVRTTEIRWAEHSQKKGFEHGRQRRQRHYLLSPCCVNPKDLKDPELGLP